jgi:hypothetical protein
VFSRYAFIAALAGASVPVSAQTPGKATVGPGSIPAGPVTPFSDVQRGYATLKTNILKSADRMPAEDYGFRPTPDVRTFARVVNHITEAQLHSCGAMNGTAADALPKVPPETADKAAIVAALQASFAECDRAYASLTDANLLQMISLGPVTRARIGFAWGNVSHDNEQYATLALYMRLKGLVPPSSEK